MHWAEPGMAPNVPGGQTSQLADPVVFANRPIAHAVTFRGFMSKKLNNYLFVGSTWGRQQDPGSGM